MDNVSLHIENLAIGYKSTIVKEIQGQLYSGDFCVLLGANGTGKSTLINTIRGTQVMRNGQVLLNQKSLITISDKELAKIIAIVTTFTNFASELTVYDIVSMGRTPYLGLFSKLTETDRNIITKYAAQLEIMDLLPNKFNQLSDGQKQRVMICRALVQNTPIILLDEPTAHLDVENRIKTFKLLQQICSKENKIVICSTHEIENALEFSTKVWLIDKKKKFITGDTSIFNKEKVLKLLF